MNPSKKGNAVLVGLIALGMVYALALAALQIAKVAIKSAPKTEWRIK